MYYSRQKIKINYHKISKHEFSKMHHLILASSIGVEISYIKYYNKHMKLFFHPHKTTLH